MIRAETLLFDDFRVAAITYAVYLDIHVPMTSMVTIEETLMTKNTVLMYLTIVALVCLFDVLEFEYSCPTATVVHRLESIHFLENGTIC